MSKYKPGDTVYRWMRVCDYYSDEGPRPLRVLAAQDIYSRVQLWVDDLDYGTLILDEDEVFYTPEGALAYKAEDLKDKEQELDREWINLKSIARRLKHE